MATDRLRSNRGSQPRPEAQTETESLPRDHHSSSGGPQEQSKPVSDHGRLVRREPPDPLLRWLASLQHSAGIKALGEPPSEWELSRWRLALVMKYEEELRVREAKRRGGLRKDPVRQAVVARIVKLLRESDELETAREVWDALRRGQRRLRDGLTIDIGSDFDMSADKVEDYDRIIITSPSGPVKIVTFQTFRSYVREAREIVQQPAR